MYWRNKERDLEYQYLKVSTEDGIGRIVIDNPPANALNSQVIQELDKIFIRLAGDNSIRAIILTGAGNFFIAGADIKEIIKISSSKEAEELARQGHEVLGRIEAMEKPVVVAINGHCLGGGLELAMACHIRVAAEKARLGLPEINLGIIPGFGGTQRLPRLVGTSKGIEMILTGDMISAQEARSLGLVNKVVPDQDLMKEALGLGKKISSKGMVAVRSAMRAIREGYQVSLENGLNIESKYFGSVCETEDMKEGLTAFIEKRQPRFKDR